MISLDVKGMGPLRLEHLVVDFNGTLACDGHPLPFAREKLRELSGSLAVHVLTADTFAGAQQHLAGIPVAVHVLGPGPEDQAKLAFVQSLGAGRTAAIGNGRNDRRMLKEAALGIAVIGPEGACREAIEAAQIVVTDVGAALDLLLRPLRLTATLRT
jgi:soluble P-type ATPase